jgi:(-)-germacrene D synthase
LARSYFVESKWCSEGYIPTYDEYKANGSISSSYPLQIISFIGLGEFSNDEILDWIFNYPTIIDAISAHGRLADDISSHKVLHILYRLNMKVHRKYLTKLKYTYFVSALFIV